MNTVRLEVGEIQGTAMGSLKISTAAPQFLSVVRSGSFLLGARTQGASNPSQNAGELLNMF
jgi:hypothetical protein